MTVHVFNPSEALGIEMVRLNDGTYRLGIMGNGLFPQVVLYLTALQAAGLYSSALDVWPAECFPEPTYPAPFDFDMIPDGEDDWGDVEEDDGSFFSESDEQEAAWDEYIAALSEYSDDDILAWLDRDDMVGDGVAYPEDEDDMGDFISW